MTYRIDKHTTERKLLGGGHVFVCLEDGESIILPLAVAEDLIRAQTVAANEFDLKLPPDPAPPSRPVPKKRGTFVEIPEEPEWRSTARDLGKEMQVWNERQLHEVIRRHNAGAGDGGNREDMAARLRQMMERGPWRPLVQPVGGLSELREAAPNFAELIDIVEGALAVSPSASFEPILLIGPPGIGKTHMARLLGEFLGVPTQFVDGASLQSNSVLLGSEQHWTTAKPGLLSDLLVDSSAANPLVIFDELDKVSRNRSHDALQPLHATLEPSSASALTDLCTGVTLDASRVRWILTCNSLKAIPGSLLSRMRLVHVREPQAREMLAIARSVAKSTIDKEAPPGFKQLSRDLLIELALMTPRSVRMLVTGAVRRAVRAGREHIVLQDLTTKPSAHPAIH